MLSSTCWVSGKTAEQSADYMNKLIFKVAVVYLVILLSVLLGMLVQMQYGVTGKVSDVVAILKDNLKNEVSDARDGVRRFQVQSSSSALISAEDYADYFIPNTKILFEKSGDGAYRGGYIVQGTFEFGDDSGHMALLLDNDGTIVNRWELTENVEGPPEPRPFSNKFPHGLELFDDGSIIYAFDVGVSLSKKSYCGKTYWTRHDLYHHSVQKVDETSVYAVTKFVVNQTSRADGFQLINVADGAMLKSFTVFDILKANPDIDPLGIRQEDFPKGSVWTEDPFHTNDIEALPPELSGYYPEFSAGDLLISMRSLNLVMVVSPDDLKIKWFRQGYTRRQHDPGPVRGCSPVERARSPGRPRAQTDAAMGGPGGHRTSR